MTENISQQPGKHEIIPPLALERMAFEAITDDHVKWLKTDFSNSNLPELHSLDRLLMAVYAYHQASTELTKKMSQQILGAEHVSTAKRYADIAAGAGYVTLEKGKYDGRAQSILPTDKLVAAVNHELSRRINHQKELVQHIDTFKS